MLLHFRLSLSSEYRAAISPPLSAKTRQTIQDLSRKVLQPWLSLESIVDGSGNALNEAISHSLWTPGCTLHKKLQVS